MKKFLYILLSFSLLLSSCRAYKELRALEKCNFQATGVENIVLGGHKMDNKKQASDFSFSELSKLVKDYSNDKLILSYTIPVDAQNPNQKLAALNKVEWKLFFDKVEILQGISSKRVEIPAGQKVNFPLDIKMNLSEVLSGKSLSEIKDLVLNLGEEHKKGNRLILKIKPYLRVGKKQIPYPGYIPVKF
ncbi:MAG: hypothetical protein GY827_09695 [Cytophagales bacterium]|nr:hypothetical protein [Cytophagales bacterium]